MAEDIKKGLDSLSGIVDSGKWVMNYPYGNYSDTVIEYISGKGCCLGLSVEAGLTDVTDKDMRYRVPRFDTNDYPPKSDNYKKFM
jgi:hypothetical protein